MDRLIMTALFSAALLATAASAMATPYAASGQQAAEAGRAASFGVWENGYHFDGK